MKIADKKKVTQDLNKRLLKSKIVIATDYMGLDVEAMNELRTKLREKEIEYQVVKNTLLIRAAEETDVAIIKDSFKGPTAIALSYDDPVAPAKVLMEFAKDHKKLEIKIGVMDGKVLDLSSIEALSKLPSREALLGQLMSVMNGVPTAFVRTLNAIPGQFVNVLNAIKDQKEAA